MKGVYKIPLPSDVSPSDHPPVKRLLASLARGAQYSISVIDAPLIVGELDGAACGHTHPAQYARHREAARYCVIEAHGGKEKSRAPLKSKATPPPPLTADQCRKRLAEAEIDMRLLRSRLPDRMRRNYAPEAYYARELHIDAEFEQREQATCAAMAAEGANVAYTSPQSRYLARRKRRRVIGAAVARIASQVGGISKYFRPGKEQYEIMDRAVGCRVKRVSELNSREQERGWFDAMLWSYADAHYRTHEEKFAAAQRETTGPRPSIAVEWDETKRASISDHWCEMLRLAIEREGLRTRTLAAVA